MLHDDYLCLVESGKEQIKEVRGKFNRKTWKQGQGWKPGYLALGCQFQFRCVETQMSGFSFGLVSRLMKNRFQFRFQFCLRTTSVSGFQFRCKFHPKKLVYFEYGFFKCSTF